MNDPLAQGLAGIMLLCAFGLLALRRPGAMGALYRIQSFTLAAAALWQGHIQHAPQLYLTAPIILTLNILLFPRLLYHAAPTILKKPAIPPIVSAGLGVILLGIAIVAVPSGGSALAIPLAVLLLGMLLIATRRDGYAQIIGLMILGNALLLAATTLPLLPFVPEFAVAIAALAALPFWLMPDPDGQEAG